MIKTDKIVIIPAYNEEMNIGMVIREIKQILPNTLIVVINDGSIDKTREEAELAGGEVLQLPHNLGIGGAIQTGLKFALRRDADIIIRLDGDGQHIPSEIPKLLEDVENGSVDMAIGSRFLEGGIHPKIPLLRQIGIFVLCKLVTLLGEQVATDPTSGFMVMNRKASAILCKNISQDYPEVDARISLYRAGLKIREYPTTMQLRQGGLSSINYVSGIYYMIKVSLSLIIMSRKVIK